MANDAQVNRLKAGVKGWNAWRQSSPEAMDLKNAHLARADLAGANLAGAYLGSAYLVGANLSGTNLAGANLTNAVLSNADLTGANLTGADVRRTQFRDATVNFNTRGLDRLSKHQMATLTRGPDVSEPDEKPEAPTRILRVTVGEAKHIINPTHQVLASLVLPPDITDKDIPELFGKICQCVAELHESLSGVNDDGQDLSPEQKQQVSDALPLWKKGWETFYLKAMEGAGLTAGKALLGGPVFAAGVIAGIAYASFAGELPEVTSNVPTILF